MIRLKCLSKNSGGVLLATNKQDITTDFLVREMRNRGVPFVRINTEDLPQAIVTFAEDATLTGTISIRGVVHPLGGFVSAYYRRPEPPEPKNVQDGEAYTYAVQEWSATTRSLWNALEGRWLNSPFAILRAEDKPRQLSVARACGLPVPPTVIGNDFDAARGLSERHRCVIKPLRRALVDAPNGPGQVIFTSELASLCEGEREAFEAVPVIVQSLIPKRRDLRVTIVDQVAIAVAIHSQVHEETRVDWRRGGRTDLVHERVTLPTEVAKACVAVVQRLDLRFAAVDLVEDCNGKFWFLEANPNGQWAWLEQVEGVSIASALVDALVK
ncbi:MULTISPECIES: hypothetical protein [Salipiger]|uniref:hypothetical protein n=1 Tax=Salipiger TaxID=263377 RepID=UPI0008E3E957|nr:MULTISPECIES: hypothetical protein [Salipiger]MBN9885679.1 hypothetical protein [Salipiger abyssi]SFD88492.1 RimK-like ATP-grasp domain-containing protein [Salipiger profundus]